MITTAVGYQLLKRNFTCNIGNTDFLCHKPGVSKSMLCTVRFPKQCMLHCPMQCDTQLHGVMYYAIVMPGYSKLLPCLFTLRLPFHCSARNVHHDCDTIVQHVMYIAIAIPVFSAQCTARWPCQCTRARDVSVVYMQHLIWDAHSSTLLMIATDQCRDNWHQCNIHPFQ